MSGIHSALLVGLAVLGLAGCQPPGTTATLPASTPTGHRPGATTTPSAAAPTPSPEETATALNLVGTWRGGQDTIVFRGDGTFSTTHAAYGDLDDGQWRLEGVILTFVRSEESMFCPSLVGSYRLEVTETGGLRFAVENDTCGVRMREYRLNTYSRR